MSYSSASQGNRRADWHNAEVGRVAEVSDIMGYNIRTTRGEGEFQHMGKNPHRILIGEAAKAFSVAAEPVRRWEISGKITSARTPGGQLIDGIKHAVAGAPS
ncbi:hypothetical protein [uncultured Thiodictyon sp.]|jgi:hypothetical protein|uniref:hypothetical protein n=1 Tax=uncultured Thiodictyon sp. TaxID=1846217 RepID=UPI0025FD391F|nr:hypothetical protein [uncultured Thiodictyon sp.]